MAKMALTLAALVALVLTACNDIQVTVPEEGPSPTPIAPVTPASPVEGDPEDCAVVSAANGAPAPLTMQDTFFEPHCIAMSGTQGFTIRNIGEALHNISVRDSGVDIDVEPGAEVTTEAIGEMVEPGTHEFFCKYHEQQGMVGTVTVE